MTELTKITKPATVEEADSMTASWPDLLHSPIQSQAQAAEISEKVKRLTVPASRQWIAGRAATLLSQYFVSSVPTEMMTAIAEDWHEELRTYPAWALQKAVRWWMSASNEKRRQKPISGDIAARAKFEMGAVRVAENALRRFAPVVSEPEPERELPTPEQKAEADRLVQEFTRRARA